jgi:hypothetical protein
MIAKIPAKIVIESSEYINKNLTDFLFKLLCFWYAIIGKIN